MLLPSAEGGEDCVVILVHHADGWRLYPHGAVSLAVALTNEQAAILAYGILGATRDAHGSSAQSRRSGWCPSSISHITTAPERAPTWSAAPRHDVDRAPASLPRPS